MVMAYKSLQGLSLPVFFSVPLSMLCGAHFMVWESLLSLLPLSGHCP